MHSRITDTKTLIDTWDAIMRPGDEPTRALVNTLNLALGTLGTRYTSNDYLRWKRGDRKVPERVRVVFIRAVLQHELGQKAGTRLADLICS
ncbi:MAG: hypothetical protein DIZ77_08255 [endosymbiont of Seepiophila jonesi]|uniref:Uncharacterized protein n=1 Tax=endosymbiont of Lamellibrachia luymesi TaxID=2200907 RepID=A0A370DS18_9GAMM|nr:MAG: hypothetical protein DIZ79_15665 [endosymbiont of Lamellibrachia luymesi]RDH92474.1 MAG: hypothetical protein DIZ77_08255 [endosymbiont of Seepiophila jonesi]